MYKMYHSSAGILKLLAYVIKKRRRKELITNRRKVFNRHFNIAQYLDTKYLEDQFVNIVKCYESIQPNINSAIKISAKFVERLNKKRKAYEF
jgi:predicted N-acyltransferase